jgi:hypothetical protein
MTEHTTNNVTVQTCSGYKVDEYPIRFELNGVLHEIVTIEDRWYDPSYEAFRVFADDSHTYILRNRVKEGYWDLTGVK